MKYQAVLKRPVFSTSYFNQSKPFSDSESC